MLRTFRFQNCGRTVADNFAVVTSHISGSGVMQNLDFIRTEFAGCPHGGSQSTKAACETFAGRFGLKHSFRVEGFDC